MKIVTCSACGGIGHQATADGLCSRSALAEQAVRRGEMTIADAARAYGVQYSSVYLRRRRVDLRAATWAAFDRVDRIRRVAASRERLWAGYAVPLTGEVTTPLSWPDELEVPAVDLRGSDHDEIPDPPHLVEACRRQRR